MSINLAPLDILKKKLDLTKSNNYVIHSDLTILGRKLFLLKDRLVEYLCYEFNADNLAVPAFNLNTTSNKKVDIKSIDLSMGSLPAASVKACNLNKGYRTPNPIHSYCFFPETNNIKFINNNKSFGKNSVFDFFIKNDFIWVNFGASIDNGFTLFHHLECVASVPYRENIKFDRNLWDGNKIQKISFEYFARNKKNFKQDFNPAVKYLIEINILDEIIINGKSIYLGSSKNISEAILNRLVEEPYFLTKQ